METQNLQTASVDLPENSKASCSQSASQDTETQSACKDGHDENSIHCTGGLRKHKYSLHIATFGVAAVAGFLLGWLLERRK